MTVKFLLEILEKRFQLLKAEGMGKYKKEILNNVIFAIDPCPFPGSDEIEFPCISVNEVTINSDLLNKNYLWVKNLLEQEGSTPNIVVLKCDAYERIKRDDCVTLCKLIETLKSIEDKNKRICVEVFDTPLYQEVLGAWPYTIELFEDTSEYVKSLSNNKYFMGLHI